MISIVVRVRDANTKRFIYTHEKSFTLCLPIGFQCVKDCNAVTITYYVKECS